MYIFPFSVDRDYRFTLGIPNRLLLNNVSALYHLIATSVQVNFQMSALLFIMSCILICNAVGHSFCVTISITSLGFQSWQKKGSFKRQCWQNDDATKCTCLVTMCKRSHISVAVWHTEMHRTSWGRKTVMMWCRGLLGLVILVTTLVVVYPQEGISI